MTPMQILQRIKADTKKLMPQLHTGGSRLYEISSGGEITERTTAMRKHVYRVTRLLDRVIDRLNKVH